MSEADATGLPKAVRRQKAFNATLVRSSHAALWLRAWRVARGHAKLYGEEHAVVQGVAPAGVINSASKALLSDVHGVPMQSINVPSTQFHRVQSTGSHIKQKSC